MAGEAEEVVFNDAIEEDLEAETKEEDKKDEDIVPVRKSKTNADFARERIAIKGKKDTEKEDGGDEELTPSARRLIEQEVEKRVAPLQDELAFRDYFSEHPEDKKFEKAARARFDAWQNVPIEEVMKTLRTSVTAEEKEKAVEKIQKNSIKGSGARPREEAVATTEADFKDVYAKVRRGETGAALKKLGVN